MFEIITQPDSAIEWTGHDLREMLTSSFHWIAEHQSVPNQLNIWPSPDGDTGTNFTLTLGGGIAELPKNGMPANEVLTRLAHGALMSARGNGGVILSQILRGIARGLRDVEKVRAGDFVKALAIGSETAYRGVVRPIEGTVLTVIRETAESVTANTNDDLPELLDNVVSQSLITVAKTPTLLPVFRQAGVVDAGALALAMFFEGALKWAKGKPVEQPDSIEWIDGRLNIKREFELFGPGSPEVVKDLHWEVENTKSLAGLKTFEIRLFSMVEDATFIDIITNSLIQGFLRQCASLSEGIVSAKERRWMRSAISYWASLVASSEFDYYPFTSLYPPNTVLIESRARILSRRKGLKSNSPIPHVQSFPIIAVASGEGIRSLFYELGCSEVVEGGETLNPSSRDLLAAINSVKANVAVLLPNSKQSLAVSRMLVEERQLYRELVIVPTLSVTSGLAAVTAINPELSLQDNVELMNNLVSTIATASITRAIRNAQVNNIAIEKGDYISIYKNEIIASNRIIDNAIDSLFEIIRQSKPSIIDIFYGSDTSLSRAIKVYQMLSRHLKESEVNLVNGGQPLYPFIFSIS